MQECESCGQAALVVSVRSIRTVRGREHSVHDRHRAFGEIHELTGDRAEKMGV